MVIKESTVYTSAEVIKILKISRSTFLRHVKGGVIRASKVGGNYRILGSELLRILESKGK